MGALLLIETLFMAIATGVGFYYDEADQGAFLVSTIITFLGGVLGLLMGRRAPKQVGEREGYVIVATVWLFYTMFGMLPFWFSGALTTPVDA
jgi:trk system potassium uptake protein TrkH